VCGTKLFLSSEYSCSAVNSLRLSPVFFSTSTNYHKVFTEFIGEQFVIFGIITIHEKCYQFRGSPLGNVGYLKVRIILLLMYAKELLVVNNPSLNSLVNSLWSLVWRMTRSRGRPFENGRMYCFSKTICTYRWGIKNVLSIVRQIYS